MLYSTFDLITQATSSHLCIFCFFNVIIAMIFITSKHGFNLDKDSEMHLPIPANDRQDMAVVEHHSLDDGSEQAANASEVVLRVYDETVVTADSKASEDDNGDNNNDTDAQDENCEERDDDDDDDDELRQRIEEFIAKVNRKWRAEMLNE